VLVGSAVVADTVPAPDDASGFRAHVCECAWADLDADDAPPAALEDEPASLARLFSLAKLASALPSRSLRKKSDRGKVEDDDVADVGCVGVGGDGVTRNGRCLGTNAALVWKAEDVVPPPMCRRKTPSLISRWARSEEAPALEEEDGDGDEEEVIVAVL